MAVFFQPLAKSRLFDAEAEIRRSVLAALPELSCLTGQTVAIAVGSRRIDRLSSVVSALVKVLKDQGADPFIVPAMGSHGGGFPEGQRAVLAGLGITRELTGARVLAGMDTILLDKTESGMPVYFSATALSADRIIVVNRIKPHTKFRAPIESGLCKMLAIGLGKKTGAETCHRHAVKHGFSIIESAARVILNRAPVVLGIGLIEDGCAQLSQIHALGPEVLVQQEKQLLKTASSMMGKIPFDTIDLLVVDRIGKDISGIGMDSNITGRHRDITGNFNHAPDPARIFVRELSEQSDGNANGVGLADVVTSRLASRIDIEKTAINAVAAISPEKAAIPVYFKTDRRCLEVCIHTAGIENISEAKIVRIRDTSSLQYMEISKALGPLAKKQAGFCQVTDWRRWNFDMHGNLFDFYPKD
jgi:hypothetical protein